MAQYRRKRGFTLIEVMVAAGILVVAMALLTILYTRASRIRAAISRENNTQTVGSQIMETILYGTGGPAEGLLYATDILQLDPDHGGTPLWITFATLDNYVNIYITDGTSSDTITQRVVPITDGLPSSITEWLSKPARDLDPNDKIEIETGSGFRCYDTYGILITNPADNPGQISTIEIYLKITDKSLPGSLPVVFQQRVKIRNIHHLD